MPADDPLLKSLSEAVETNLQNEHFGVEELAEVAGMSRSNLHRKLQDLTGQSVSQFIREYRLERALELLQNENLTASEVAHQVGFGSATYFSKSFHEFYGFTPGEAKEGKSSVARRPSRGVKQLRFLPVALILVVASIAAAWFFGFGESQPEANEAIEKSIAVLPFKNLQENDENQYFADGVMDAVLLNLSKVNELDVRSRTSSDRFRDSTLPLQEIANQLNVNYILEGSAQKYDDDIRITVQLILAATDGHLWSNDYTGKFQNVLTLQSEIAEKVATELKTALSSEELDDLKRPLTNNPEAYNNYLLGNFQYNRLTEIGLSNAIPFYERAIELDPNFVEAYIGLSGIWATGGVVWGIYPEKEGWSKAKTLLNKAMEIDPYHPEIYENLGSGKLYFEWDFNSAITDLETSKQLRGIYGEFSADIFLKMGRLDIAQMANDHQMKESPLSSSNYFMQAEILHFKGRTREAISQLDKANDLFEDSFLLRESAKLYYLYGEIDKSKMALTKHQRNHADRPPLFFWLKAVYAHHDGNDPTPHLQKLEEMYNEVSSGSPAWFLALTYAAMENDELLFEWLEKSYERHEVEMTWLKMEPALDPYKEDPRYLDLMDRMNFPEVN